MDATGRQRTYLDGVGTLLERHRRLRSGPPLRLVGSSEEERRGPLWSRAVWLGSHNVGRVHTLPAYGGDGGGGAVHAERTDSVDLQSDGERGDCGTGGQNLHNVARSLSG